MGDTYEESRYERKDSVEVTRNAKGEYGWKIKLYYATEEQQIEAMVADLKETDNQLREAFL